MLHRQHYKHIREPSTTIVLQVDSYNPPRVVTGSLWAHQKSQLKAINWILNPFEVVQLQIGKWGMHCECCMQWGRTGRRGEQVDLRVQQEEDKENRWIYGFNKTDTEQTLCTSHTERIVERLKSTIVRLVRSDHYFTPDLHLQKGQSFPWLALWPELLLEWWKWPGEKSKRGWGNT